MSKWFKPSKRALFLSWWMQTLGCTKLLKKQRAINTQVLGNSFRGSCFENVLTKINIIRGKRFSKCQYKVQRIIILEILTFSVILLSIDDLSYRFLRGLCSPRSWGDRGPSKKISRWFSIFKLSSLDFSSFSLSSWYNWVQCKSLKLETSLKQSFENSKRHFRNRTFWWFSQSSPSFLGDLEQDRGTL